MLQLSSLFPQLGTDDAQIKVPAVENPELTKLSFCSLE